MKFKKSIILIVIAMLLTACFPAHCFAASGSCGLLNYTATMKVRGSGSVYFDYGKNMRFFLEDGYTTYASSCKVKSGTAYKFFKLTDRHIIVRPSSGYYFDGIYNAKGKKVSFTKTNVDILRVTVNGIYHYDYFASYNNSKYKNYSQSAYEKLVKNYVKTIYGTSRYKVMGSEVLYKLPKSTASYTVTFKKKTAPKISYSKTINKVNGCGTFYAIPSKPSNYAYTFKSSNTGVLAVEKKTGKVSVKSPGKAVITCNVAGTTKTLPAVYRITVTVRPSVVTSVTAKKTAQKSLSVKWKGNTKNSGYEIQVSNNKSFSNILAKKTVTSGKSVSTTVKLKSSVANNYVRIRAYKVSDGKKIYGSYTVKKITK